MRVLTPTAAARAAAPAAPGRPATATLLDTPDARLVTFRLAPGQLVPPHRNASTVLLAVLAGSGVIAGAEGERRCAAGDLVVFAPDEVHGMRADTEELVLLATIRPRPGARPASPAELPTGAALVTPAVTSIE
jgi:quercetin dioxygenase-like cupin family protein